MLDPSKSIISPTFEKGGFMRNPRLLLIAEIGLSLALFIVFAMVKITLPANFAGGSISLSMLPLVVLALLRGPKVGLLAGLLAGTLDYILEPYAVSFVQVLLDYPLAFTLVGLAGIFSKQIFKAHKDGKTILVLFGVAIATFLGGMARFIAHFISGVVFFSENAPAGQNILLYSFGYQVTYMLPSIVAVIILSVIIVPILIGRVRMSDTE